MSKADLPYLLIYKGDDIIGQQFQVVSDQLPVDLSSVDDIEIDIQNDPSQTAGYLIAKKSTNEIAVTNGPQGLLTLSLSSAQTANLLAPQNQVNLDIVVTIGGKQRTYRVDNGLTVLARNS